MYSMYFVVRLCLTGIMKVADFYPKVKEDFLLCHNRLLNKRCQLQKVPTFPSGSFTSPLALFTPALILSPVELLISNISFVSGVVLINRDVTYIGSNVEQFLEHPIRWVGVLLFIAVSLWASRKLERHFTRSSSDGEDLHDLNQPAGKSISS